MNATKNKGTNLMSIMMAAMKICQPRKYQKLKSEDKRDDPVNYNQNHLKIRIDSICKKKKNL
ncbi:MAG TPA: hypothetical protein VFT71_02225 [Candidatus Nitrosocosmicus sp.]|nr:hypothetical protein [Candidatus Nitrosocosmicus sp.]